MYRNTSPTPALDKAEQGFNSRTKVFSPVVPGRPRPGLKTSGYIPVERATTTNTAGSDKTVQTDEATHYPLCIVRIPHPFSSPPIRLLSMESRTQTPYPVLPPKIADTLTNRRNQTPATRICGCLRGVNSPIAHSKSPSLSAEEDLLAAHSESRTSTQP